MHEKKRSGRGGATPDPTSQIREIKQVNNISII